MPLLEPVVYLCRVPDDHADGGTRSFHVKFEASDFF